MKRIRRSRTVAFGVVMALAIAACGGDDDDTGGGDDTEADAGDDTADTGDDAGDDAGDDTGDDTADTGDDTGDDGDDTGDDGDETGGDSGGQEAEGDVDTELEENTDERTQGGSIIVGLEAEATGLRPWEDACSSPCYNMMVSIFDKLMEQRADGTLGPWLAESLEPNEDFSVWTMVLRPDISFTDGTPVNAQTIVDMYAIQQTGATAAGAISVALLDTVTAEDDLTVTYTLTGPNSSFPSALERVPLGAVFQPEAAAADPDGFSMAPIGTGPFMVETRDLDNETVLVKNPNYWMTDQAGNPLPYLDSVTFRPIPDEGTRLDSLLSGTVDVMQTLRQGTIRDARDAVGGDDGYTLYEHQGNNVGGGMFNTAVPPFDDLRVRMGLTMMNNQDAVIDALGGTGISLPGTQWFSPDSVWWTQEAADAWPVFDYEGGQAMLGEYINDPERSDGKAVGEPIDIDLACPPDPSLIAAMQVLEQLWSQSGLANVSLSNADQQTHINNALGAPPDFNGTHQAHCWRWSNENDPASYLNPAFAPPTPEVAEANGLTGTSPTNFPNYFNIDIYNWLNEAIATDDFETRKELYKQVMIQEAADVPIWFSGHTATMFGATSDIVGLNSWVLPDGTLGIGFPEVNGRWVMVSVEG